MDNLERMNSTLPTDVQILYIPVASPPTPAASPRPARNLHLDFDQAPRSGHRHDYLLSVITSCTHDELLFMYETIAPLLRRQFQFTLPEELLLYVFSFVDDLSVLLKASLVSKQWLRVSRDDSIWKAMCVANNFNDWGKEELEWQRKQRKYRGQLRKTASTSTEGDEEEATYRPFTFRRYFRDTYITHTNWRRGGKLLNAHRLPILPPDSGTVTSVALDGKWLVVGLANSMIKVYKARKGVLVRTLKGHDSGVWGVCLVSGGGDVTRETMDDLANGVADVSMDSEEIRDWPRDGLHVMPGESLAHRLPPEMRRALGIECDGGGAEDKRQRAEARGGVSAAGVQPGANLSNPCYASQGWGQANPIIVSGGCDKVIRVWDLKSGQCIYALHGHVSTVRSLRVLNTRPIAVTGSRDATLRVWDVQMGRCLRVLAGHEGSVRCLDVYGNKVVSGSYDTTCRLWDIDTGKCLHVLQGHFSQIYSVAFDGVRIASGGLDTSVRIWDAETGQCTALLQGHTALVCQLQLSPTLLATGGSDGRVITFELDTYTTVHRIAAHDSSVTALQVDAHFLVTGGNDGRVRVFETRTGNFVRELTVPAESVWKVVCSADTCAIMCKRGRHTVVEIWGMHPRHSRGAPAQVTG